MVNVVTATVLIIGNEVLSGRTQDVNSYFIAQKLFEHNITLREIRVIRDEIEEIVAAINELRKKYNYVFTTGGIGPTHDDITAQAIARAFGVDLWRHPEAVKKMEDALVGTNKLNESRLRMTEVPRGATLISDTNNKAPGFVIENVYVMAGIPYYMQSAFNNILPTLKTGQQFYSRAVKTSMAEGEFAHALTNLQTQYLEVEIGSYPVVNNSPDVKGTTLVLKSTERDILEEATQDLIRLLRSLGGDTELE